MRTIDYLLARKIKSIALCVVCAVASSGYAELQTLDRIVLIVNDSAILQNKFNHNVQSFIQRIENNNEQPPPRQIIEKNVLNTMIIDSILLQIAKKSSVRVDDKMINRSMEKIAAERNMTLSEFQEELNAQTSNGYRKAREELTQRMTIEQVKRRAINSRINITKRDIDNLLDSPEGEKLRQRSYYLLHLMIPFADRLSTRAQNERIRYLTDVRKKITSAPQFSQWMERSLKYPTKTRDMQWRTKQDTPQIFWDALTGAQKDQVVGPLKSSAGIHLLYIVDKQGGKIYANQTKVQHILMRPSQVRTNEENIDQLTTLRKDILNGKEFGALARTYSDDHRSALEGGNLGWVIPEELDPIFVEAMNKTEIGSISLPFESQFGAHILKVQDRRHWDITDQTLRSRAREVLYLRRYDEELETWFTELRVDAFIDPKTPKIASYLAEKHPSE